MYPSFCYSDDLHEVVPSLQCDVPRYRVGKVQAELGVKLDDIVAKTKHSDVAYSINRQTHGYQADVEE